MNLKDGITAYQQNGDLAIVSRIMEDADETDFLGNPTRRYKHVEGQAVSITLGYPHEYISYRIRAIREKAAKHAFHIRRPVRWAYAELNRQLSILTIDLGLDIPFEAVGCDGYIYMYEHTPELLRWARDSYEEIQRLYNEQGTEYDRIWFGRVLEIVEKTEETAVKEEERIRAEVMCDMEAGLKRALGFVDAARSEKEIVTYVNRALLTHYYDVQSARNGLRRLRKGGLDRVIKPQAMSALGTVIGTEVKEDAVWRYITYTQANFLRELTDAAATDLREGDTEAYGLSRDGKYVMSGERAAEISGLSYDAARRRLARVRKKFEKRC